MATSRSSKSSTSGTDSGQETADRTQVVETVVRSSGMQRQQVENVLSFMEQSGFRVVAGSGGGQSQDEQNGEGGQQEK